MDKESDDIARAQKCMDDIPSSLSGATLATAAQACFDIIAKYDSQQANIIKCSSKFLGGGLTTQKIATAYDKLTQNGLANKEATFIAALALSGTAAQDGKPYCVRSGVPALIYLADLAVIGSTMASVIGGGYDPDNLSTLDPADISGLLTACQPPADCGASNYAAIGASAGSLADQYCVAGNENSDACAQFNQAVANSGGDAVLTAKHLFCLLDNKTFNGTACVP